MRIIVVAVLSAALGCATVTGATDAEPGASESETEMVCQTVEVTGSRLKKKVCRPKKQPS